MRKMCSCEVTQKRVGTPKGGIAAVTNRWGQPNGSGGHGVVESCVVHRVSTSIAGGAPSSGGGTWASSRITNRRRAPVGSFF